MNKAINSFFDVLGALGVIFWMMPYGVGAEEALREGLSGYEWLGAKAVFFCTAALAAASIIFCLVRVLKRLQDA